MQPRAHHPPTPPLGHLLPQSLCGHVAWALPLVECGSEMGRELLHPSRRAQRRRQILQCLNSWQHLHCYQPSNSQQTRCGWREEQRGAGGRGGASQVQISVSFFVLWWQLSQLRPWYWGHCVITSHLPHDSQAPALSEVAHSPREPSPCGGFSSSSVLCVCCEDSE